MNILIVEDDILTAELIQKKVTRFNHNAEIASDGKSALYKVKQKKFDLVFMDIVLPDINGGDLIPQIKSIWHDMRIITMTGHNSRKLELKIRNLGIFYYLIKPFDIDFIITIIDHIAAKKP